MPASTTNSVEIIERVNEGFQRSLLLIPGDAYVEANQMPSSTLGDTGLPVTKLTINVRDKTFTCLCLGSHETIMSAIITARKNDADGKSGTTFRAFPAEAVESLPELFNDA